MTDIVKRLYAHPGPELTVTEQFRVMVEQRHEAAAEIKQLRLDLAISFEKYDARGGEIEQLREQFNARDGLLNMQRITINDLSEQLATCRELRNHDRIKIEQLQQRSHR